MLQSLYSKFTKFFKSVKTSLKIPSVKNGKWVCESQGTFQIFFFREAEKIETSKLASK